MIVFTPSKNRILNGLSSALKTCYPDKAIVWIPEKKPIFDMAYEVSPEFLFLDEKYINNHAVEALQELKIPTILCSMGCSEGLEDIVKLILLDDVRCPAHVEQNLPSGIPKYRVKPAANYAKYKHPTPNYKLSCDIGYINQSVNIPPYTMQHLSYIEHNTTYSFKVMGQPCPYTGYVGMGSPQDIMSFSASSKAMVDYDYNLLLENATNRIFTITNVEQEFFPFANTVDELKEHLNKYISEEKLMRKITKQAYKKAIAEDTYFHRLADIGEIIDHNEWVNTSTQTLNRLRT